MSDMIAWLDTHFFLTAMMEWLSCMIFILISKKKLHGFRLFLYCIAMFLIQSSFLFVCTEIIRPIISLDSYTWMLIRMPFHILLMGGFLFFCCDTTLPNVICFHMKAFLLAEFSWAFLLEFDDPVQEWLGLSQFLNPSAAQWVSRILICIVIFGIVYVWEKRFINQILQYPLEKREAFFILFISMMTFLITAILERILKMPFTVSHSLIDFMGLLFVSEYVLRVTILRMNQEVTVIQTLMEKQAQQYLNNQENIEMVNHKYHDMKQMLLVLNADTDEQEKSKYLKEIYQDIQKYEACGKTGNSILDTILSEKHLYCIRNEIQLSYVIDGKWLETINAMDLCVIFGNALDNAIECVSQISDVSKRLIHVTVYNKNQFLFLIFENIFEQPLVMQEGLPVTNKDKDYHGYGLKSIQYVVKKYDGAMRVSTHKKWFQLKILIPLS